MLSNLYDKGYLLKCLVWIAIVCGLMKATGGAGFGIVIPMVLYSLLARKPESLFFWLLISVCALIANPNIVTKGGIFGWEQRGLMLGLGGIMAFNVMAYPKHNVLKPFLGMMVYVLFMFVSSAYGWCPPISFLKLILFAFIYFSYFGVANQVGINPNVSSRRIRSVMLAVAMFFVFGSMALVPFPHLSQLQAKQLIERGMDFGTTTSLFMGMTNHSQCLGPVISSTSVVLFADLLFSIKKADPLYILMLLCCPYLIYLTSSRTGMGAYLLGMMFVVFLFIKARGIGCRWRSRVLSAVMICFMSLGVVAMFTPSIQQSVTRFILKSGNEDCGVVNTENVLSSRQGLIDKSVIYFKESPLIGNGFQVSEAMKNIRINGIGSVLSAPVEKGVWITAVLEEGGIIGWLIFVGFLINAIVKSIKQRAYMGAACLFVMCLTNLGEFTFFSMSYTGGFVWAMVFVGLSLDIRKMKDENAALMRQMAMQQYSGEL